MSEARGRGRHSIILSGAPSQVNAFRRVMLSDLEMVAPSYVDIRENTSSSTDEYIAHRIGIIPFSQNATNQTTALLTVRGCDAYTDAIVSDTVRPLHSTILIARLLPGQSLDLTIHFDSGCATTHACFMRTAAVGMRPVPSTDAAFADDRHMITFDAVLGDEDATHCLRMACASIRRRLLDAKASLAGSSDPVQP